MSEPRKRVDNGYPFKTGHWQEWSSKERLDWAINLRDKTRDEYKDTLEISDEEIVGLSADVEYLEKVYLHQEFAAAQTAAQQAPTPRESAKMLGELIDDVCANNYYKARRIGFTDADIEKMRADADKYLADIEEWEQKQTAQNILGFDPPKQKPVQDMTKSDDVLDSETLGILRAFGDIDISKLLAARDDAEAAHREFQALIPQLEAKAAKDPVFAKWFEEFRAEQERLLRWDDTLGDDDE